MKESSSITSDTKSFLSHLKTPLICVAGLVTNMIYIKDHVINAYICK